MQRKKYWEVKVRRSTYGKQKQRDLDNEETVFRL